MAFDLRCSRCLLAAAVFLAAGFGLLPMTLGDVGGVLLGGAGQTVDAVRVDLQRTATPRPARRRPR